MRPSRFREDTTIPGIFTVQSGQRTGVGADPRRGEARKEAAASILLISGCQDNQLSADGEVNGLFTGELLRVWKHGAFKGSYPDFHRAILRRMPPDQTPNYFRAGRPAAAFERQRPFTV